MQLHTAIGLFTSAVISLGSACTAMAQAPPSDSQLEALGLENRWEAQATLNVNRDVVRYVTNDEENVYVQSSAGAVTALNAENGRQLWTRQVGANDNPSLRAISNSKLVVVTSGPDVIGLNKFSGDLVFQHRLPSVPTAPPTIDEGRLYVPLGGGSVYIYSIRTLSYLTRYKVLPPEEARAFLYKFVCGEDVVRAPIVGNRTMAFLSEAGVFYSVETEGIKPGRTRFQLGLSNTTVTNPVLTQGIRGLAALILTSDGQVLQIDMTTGNNEWSFSMGRQMTQEPIAVGSGVYVVTQDRVVTKLNRDGRIGPLGRPAEIPNHSSPNVIGVGLREVELPDNVKNLGNVQATTGVQVTEVTPGSEAERTGLVVGDIIVVVDGLEASSVAATAGIFAELPLRVPRRIQVIRNGQLERLQIRIKVREWEALGIKTLLAVGRYSVFGIDGAGRLVAIDRQKGHQLAVTDPTGFNTPVINAKTDQVYLATSSGRVICMREIGPTITVPESTPLTQFSKVIKMHVQVGDAVSSTGTPLCEIQIADGSTYTVSSNHAGIVQRVMLQPGNDVMTGSNVLRISDDQFATYHQRPQQRPVDIDVDQGANAEDAGGQ